MNHGKELIVGEGRALVGFITRQPMFPPGGERRLHYCPEA